MPDFQKRSENLKCDGAKECLNPASMIDRKGYIYCEAHGTARRTTQPCRKLLKRESRLIAQGQPIGRY